MANSINQPELRVASIVALGSLNPLIFHPKWFSEMELLREEEAEQAENLVVTGDVSMFNTQWMTMQVTSSRFEVRTIDPTMHRPLRDLVQGTFQVLEHTPIGAFGINNHLYVQLGSNEERRGFGDHFAPKSSWQDIMANPSLRSLVMEGKREPESQGRIQVRIESNEQSDNGVMISVNEHYEVRNDEGMPCAKGNAILVETLGESWESFVDYSCKTAEHLVSQFKA